LGQIRCNLHPRPSLCAPGPDCVSIYQQSNLFRLFREQQELNRRPWPTCTPSTGTRAGDLGVIVHNQRRARSNSDFMDLRRELDQLVDRFFFGREVE